MRFLFLAGQRPPTLGVSNGLLAACPTRPNCVCSDASDALHHITALSLNAPPAQAWAAARAAISSLPRTQIVSESDGYLHAECRSALFGFVDDLELHLRPQDGLIAVRSAARLGYRDFGVNRKRIEQLRMILSEQKTIR